MMSTHLTAVLQALFVVILWATSWVLIKIGLQDLPPLTFAGLRYALAFLILLPVLTWRQGLGALAKLPGWAWRRLVLLGVLFYAATQGAMFVALAHLPAVTVNLLWSFSSVAVALLGIAWLSERPGSLQWAGILLAAMGAVIYFNPLGLNEFSLTGILAAVCGVAANAVSSILGREVNRSEIASPLAVTVVSMGIGAALLLAVGIAIEGLPTLSLQSWGILLWLALVNTALAFTLWNHILRTLSAVESSIINGTMIIWIPILALLFLGEQLNGRELLGLAAAAAGTLMVQARTQKPRPVESGGNSLTQT